METGTIVISQGDSERVFAALVPTGISLENGNFQLSRRELFK